MVQPIPDGYHSVTPYLIYKNAKAAIEFYKHAFNAVHTILLEGPGGTVAHAEILIGNSHVMLADESPEFGAISAETLGGSAVHMMIYVEDVDAAFAQAVAAGGTELHPLKDQFYGDRTGTIQDPFGYQWTLATHIEDISLAETQKRFDKMMQADG